MKYHYIYRVTSESGKFYVGRHTTSKIDDGYMGSGKWVRSLKDKTILSREIIEYCDTFEDLLIAEKRIIDEVIGTPGCMNFSNNPVGFASGAANPNCTPHARESASVRISGEKNPSKMPGIGDKISSALKGKPGTMLGKKHTVDARAKMSAARKGIVISPETRKKYAERRKEEIAAGTRILPSFAGRTHAPDSIAKMKKPKPTVTCPVCGKVGGSGAMHRFHFDLCRDGPERLKRRKS